MILKVNCRLYVDVGFLVVTNVPMLNTVDKEDPTLCEEGLTCRNFLYLPLEFSVKTTANEYSLPPINGEKLSIVIDILGIYIVCLHFAFM